MFTTSTRAGNQVNLKLASRPVDMPLFKVPKSPPKNSRPAWSCKSRQQGFSLIEVSIVTAIMLLLAIIAVPAIGGYVIENKVPKVGEELARFILQSKVNAPSGAQDPYGDVNAASLANLTRDSSVFTVTGTGSALKVFHGLGSGGEITIAAGETAAEFTLSLDKVNHAACPSIASVMQRVVDKISVTQGGTSKELKNDTLPYNALAAQASCSKGDLNTFTFTIS